MAAFTPPPQAPERGDRATFSQRVDAFLTWLVALIPQLNAFVASLNARDSGGANTYAYTFDSATGDIDPGNGKLRLDSAMQSSATTIRIDTVSGSGVDISAVLDALGAGTSNVKGSVRLQKGNDPTAWLVLDVTSVVSPGGYRNMVCSVKASSSSAPFANGDSIVVFIDRNGDKGDGGGTPTEQQIRDAVGTMPISSGGTGATTAQGARQNLGAPSADSVLSKGMTNDSASTRFASGLPGPISTLTPSAPQSDQVALTISNSSNNFASAVIQFLRGGQYAAFFGLDTDNKWKVGGYSMGNIAYEIWHGGNFVPSNYAQLSGAAFAGNVSAAKFTATSDESLKTNWRALPDTFLEDFAAIECAGLFDWKEGGETDGGLGAQSLQKIAPWCVYKRQDGTLGVNYDAINATVCHALTRRVLRNEARA